MKGLDWFRVMTDIAWDGDLEHVSDAAFRTFFELVAMSAYHLTDGVVPLSTARKHLNTRRVNDALEALSKQGCITLDADKVTINNYEKYQQTREEVEAERAKNRDRVRRYRAVTNAEVTEQSKSKSKKKPPIPLTGEQELLFDQFWSLYPKKEGKGTAKGSFVNALAKTGAATIISGLRRQLPYYRNKERQYIPMPTTWLNQERWDDEPEEPRPNSVPTYTPEQIKAMREDDRA